MNLNEQRPQNRGPSHTYSINMRVNEEELRLLSTRRIHKLKPSHHRAGKALTLQEVEVLRISGMSAHELSKFDSPTYRPPLLQRKHTCYSFLLEDDSTLGIYAQTTTRRLEWLSKCRILMTPPDIETATFRLVSQCLNHLQHRLSPYANYSI